MFDIIPKIKERHITCKVVSYLMFSQLTAKGFQFENPTFIYYQLKTPKNQIRTFSTGVGNDFNELRRKTGSLGTPVRLMNTDRETNYDKSFS